MNNIGTQNFETKRCFLRRIKLSDYTMMYENWAKYDEVSRYYPFIPFYIKNHAPIHIGCGNKLISTIMV